MNGMDRFWIVQPWPSADAMESLLGHCAIVNVEEVFGARQPSGTVWRDFPTAQLKLTVEGFAEDCFTWEGCMFVSKRLRGLMAVEPAAAQFFDVDLSASTESARSSEYQIMSVSTLEDGINLWEQPPITTADGAVIGFGKAFHRGFRPTHDLFHDRAARGYVFCTDALALSVLKGGCTALRFFDPARFQFSPQDTFRTLRGVERKSRETGELELVEAIT